MSCTQLAFNSGDLAFQEIITSRPYRDSDRPIAPLLPVCRRHVQNHHPLHTIESRCCVTKCANFGRLPSSHHEVNRTSGSPNWADGLSLFLRPAGHQLAIVGDGYLLLQRAVETITGLSIDRFLADEIFRPSCGLQDGMDWRRSCRPVHADPRQNRDSCVRYA
jgi:hypothetical protein